MSNLNSYYAGMGQFRRLAMKLLIIAILGLGGIVSSVVAQTSGKSIKIIALGDSLTAGLGVETANAYPAKLEAALRAKGLNVEVINAGVSGDTSTGGLARLDWAVPDSAKIVIVELGANDALRGLEPEITRKSMTKIISRLQERGKIILLAGMLAPPNLGPEYGEKFAAIYSDLGKADGVTFYRFFLEGVAADPTLNQPDGLHPTAAGYTELVKRLAPVVEKLIKNAGL